MWLLPHSELLWFGVDLFGHWSGFTWSYLHTYLLVYHIAFCGISSRCGHRVFCRWRLLRGVVSGLGFHWYFS